jgi:hypothetical protein
MPPLGDVAEPIRRIHDAALQRAHDRYLRAGANPNAPLADAPDATVAEQALAGRWRR